MDSKLQFLELIQSNIKDFGYHVTVVNSDIEPRYAYTIGLTNLLGFELVFAGGVYYFKDELSRIFNEIVGALKLRGGTINTHNISVGSLGTFSFTGIDQSWTSLMLLGAFDYYKTKDIKAFQVIPDANHYTLDIPRMSNKWAISSEPVWQWLNREWNYSVPSNSTVVTNIKALQGEAITELMRWESDQWEMFAGVGPDVLEKDIRVVSIGTILGIDQTLLPAIDLNIGKGLMRDSRDSEWDDWG